MINIKEDFAFKKEIEFIKLYRQYKYCEANHTDGGEGLRNPSVEIRNKIANSVRGSKHSEHTKLKMSKSRLGHPGYTKGIKMSVESSMKKSEAMKRCVTVKRKMILCLNTGEVFKSLTEAKVHFKISGTSNISKVLKGQRHSANGLRFEYV